MSQSRTGKEEERARERTACNKGQQTSKPGGKGVQRLSVQASHGRRRFLLPTASVAGVEVSQQRTRERERERRDTPLEETGTASISVWGAAVDVEVTGRSIASPTEVFDRNDAK